MSFFENIQGVFETQFGTMPRPEGGGSTGGAGDWNTLANRPFGYVEHYDLLPETSVQFSGGNPAIGGLGLSSPLTEGKAYPVNFDGTQYLCKYESGKLGNLALEDGTDTGEPFLWYVTESMILTTAGAGTHTISLQGDVPQRVPYEYLPFGYYKTQDIFSETRLDLMEQGGIYGAFLPITYQLDIDMDYVVTFNGVSYECRGRYAENNTTLIFVGNEALNGGKDTGEPFLIINQLSDGTYLTVLITMADSVTARIQTKELVKISEELIEVPTLDLVKLGMETVTEDRNYFVNGIDMEQYKDILLAAVACGRIKLRFLGNTRCLSMVGSSTKIIEIYASVQYDPTYLNADNLQFSVVDGVYLYNLMTTVSSMTLSRATLV